MSNSMSKRDEIRNSLEREDEFYVEFLDKTRKLVELVPYVQERRRDVEAVRKIVENAPDDVLDEAGSALLEGHRFDEQRAERLVGLVAPVSLVLIEQMATGTSVVSEYIQMTNSVIDETSPAPWSVPFRQSVEKIAAEKAKKKSLPPRLDMINHDLGEKFTKTQRSVEKARADIIGVDQAVKRMRDILQQLWGGLGELARKRGPRRERRRGLKHGREKDQVFVSRQLLDDERGQKRLMRLIGILSKMKGDLSDTDFMKNPLSDDVVRMNEIYERWVILIDDIVDLVYPSIFEDDS